MYILQKTCNTRSRTERFEGDKKTNSLFLTISKNKFQGPLGSNNSSSSSFVLQRSRIINVMCQMATHVAKAAEKSLAGSVIILVQENLAGLFVRLETNYSCRC